jgi:glycerol-3-phosphate dehydrogenase
VRPLYDDASGNVSTMTRDYVFDVEGGAGQAPLLSIFGGKITTYRRLAEHALAKLQPLLGFTAGPWTRASPLPGGDMPGANLAAFIAMAGRRHPWLPEPHLRRWARTYGTRLDAMIDGRRRLEDLGADLGGGLYEAEVDHLVANEWARTAEDILWRRTRLGLHVGADTAARLEKLLAVGGRIPAARAAATAGSA